jgi:galactokinase
LGNKDFSSFLQISGSYECSIPEIDRIVDIACGLHGVEGAQLAGAGLGGCAMVLAQKDFAADIVWTLRDNNIDADIFVPIGGACSLELI